MSSSTANKQKGIRLIPFTVNRVVEQANEIPPGVQLIHAPEIWEKSEKGNDIVVAVLDTGCDVNHVDLKDRIIGGRNFTEDYGNDPNNYLDNNGHGTHVAGTIAATENDIGVLGVAPLAKLLVLKVLAGDGSGNYQHIIDAIDYAISWRGPNQERVRIISMSLGGPEDVPELHEVIQKAVKQDVLVVCAAGNSGDCNDRTEELDFPGAYSEVIEVGAVNLERKLACFSNSNQEIDLVAPGEDILSTYPGGKYAVLSGTSMATPHISGALALLIKQCEREYGRRLSEPEIYAQLIKRTVPLGYERTSEGNGLIDLVKEENEKQKVTL
ncbi:S8 family peptidase [Bacillus cytotoxicus]|uniref:Peptidase S8 and S53 subtilisin kexin sedolisin n=1 Tax=Bacillus cytotoxicus (strain DSM 22905 / CIP 110041 / 391-98 / NVH 391-98) TaxID=315749 RepID=A7GNW8_BACCN|nr:MULTISPECIES: S8 family peptidase [Bacillus cereus group]ABS21826.1 peptidase S8 and S53 subtilisin kexin sedolisin [Bacillus cytotoxicus NVH 391-98]AWC28436.1 serine protease [Bacillus cytotoxicus]AWC40179.1 serine protease [Bacillus cytotoxicus]AWC44517.1 serine protease [Bacillus cytotoxicus]AWC48110.1 serine protease [Bacillus cytotoxicus]